MIVYDVIYTFDEAAELLKITGNDLWELIDNSHIPYVLIRGNKLIRGIDLENYINNLSAL